MVSSNLYPPKATMDNEGGIDFPAADWLCLAAAPTFAIMALVTCVQEDGSTPMLCSAGSGMSVLYGMVPMYVLMSAFHVAPWLKLISRWRRATDALRSHTRAQAVGDATTLLPR